MAMNTAHHLVICVYCAAIEEKANLIHAGGGQGQFAVTGSIS